MSIKMKYRANVNTLSRDEAATLGHYKARLRAYIQNVLDDGPREAAQKAALRWYRDTLTELHSPDYWCDLNVNERAWVLATLSPMTTFEQNLSDLRKYCTARFQCAVMRLDLDGFLPSQVDWSEIDALSKELGITAYRANIHKCVLAQRAHFPEDPSGPKVRSFYHAIISGGTDTVFPPVIDLWMVRAATGDPKETTLTNRKMALIERAIVELHYEESVVATLQYRKDYEEYLRKEWKEEPVRPWLEGIGHHDLQALIWVAIRGSVR